MLAAPSVRLATAGHARQIAEMSRDHIEQGVINGPRIIPSGSIRLNANLTEDAARAEIRRTGRGKG